jgi:hypothetical protein
MRRWTAVLCLSAMTIAMLPAWAQDARLPQRNLLVELRWTEAHEHSVDGASARGGITVGTAGNVDARGSVVVRSARGDAQAQAVQRLTVLNGGHAGVRLAEAVPLQWVEIASTPRGNAGVVHQAWVQTGSSFEVAPRWPGGNAPVMVEVSHGSSGVAAASAPQGEEAFTTLRVPMNEWVTVAQDGEAAVHRAEGTVSSRDAERRTHRLLQMRISAP